MKFIALLVAAVAAVKINADPAASEAARVSTLNTSRQVVATQNKFEADHLAMHTKNMNTADKECADLKENVRSARHTQVTEGNQYPAYKTY